LWITVAALRLILKGLGTIWTVPYAPEFAATLRLSIGHREIRQPDFF
jgi:hypothetical protein